MAASSPWKRATNVPPSHACVGRTDPSGSSVGRRFSRAGLCSPILQLKQLVINSAECEQMLMAAGLAQLPFVEHENLVHVLDGGKAVRDRQRRTAGHEH